MKFGKYLEAKQLEFPEYLGYFINYKHLKKLIKQLSIIKDKNGQIITNPKLMEKALQDNKSTFFFRVERELEKINEFYLEKQSDLKLTLDILINKKLQLLNNIEANDSKNKLQSSKSNNNNKDNNSITFQTLYTNFKNFTSKLNELSQFVELNETGFRKILKKWDKRSKSHLQEIYLSTTITVQPVFHKEEINQLNDLVANSLLELEAYADGENVMIIDQPQDNGSIFEGVNNNNNGPISETQLTDEFYLKFLNIATAPNNQLILLSNWLNKIKDTDNVERLTRVFFLSINAPVEDIYLINFYNFFKKFIDLKFIDDYTNKNFLHQIAISIFINEDKEEVANLNFKPNNIIMNWSKINKFDDKNFMEVNKNLSDEKLNSAESKNQENTNNEENFTRFFLIKALLLEDDDNYTNLISMKDNNNKTPLHYAAEYGRFDLLKPLVDNKDSKEIIHNNNGNYSPIHLAIKNNHLKCVKYLLSNQMFAKSSIPILTFACKFGNYEIVEAVLDYKEVIDIHSPDVEGLFPMHIIAKNGHYQIVQLLINNGNLNPNELCHFNKWSPIFYAAFYGHPRTARELIKYGAIVGIVDEKLKEPIYYAALNGHVNVLNILFHSTNSNNTNANSKVSIQSLLEQKRMANSVTSTPTNITEMFKMKKPTKQQSQSSPQSLVKSTNSTISSTNSSLMVSKNKINIDTIPSLALPPPIIPLRKYGHNFLEKKISLQIFFSSGKSSIKLNNYQNNFKKNVKNNNHEQNKIIDNDNIIENDDDEEIFNNDPNSPIFPGRITIISSSSDIVPRNLILPINPLENFVNFQIDNIDDDNFQVEFELFPTFGTKIIAKTTALSNVFKQNNNDFGTVTLPLFDQRVKNIGSLTFKYELIHSFNGLPLELSQYETYWKSTNDEEKNNNQLTSMLSIVSASSLSGQYLKINVCMLNDGASIIAPNSFIELTSGIKLSLINLTSKELFAIASKKYDIPKVIEELIELSKQYEVCNNDDKKSVILRKISEYLNTFYLPLDELLMKLSNKISLNIDIYYPTKFEFENYYKRIPTISLNSFIDSILLTIFQHIRSNSIKRNIVFSSYNPMICKILNWKQPNFPVLFAMGGIWFNYQTNEFQSTSANGFKIESEMIGKETSDVKSVEIAMKFASINNFLGIILPIKLLSLVPELSKSIRSNGLILIGAKDDSNKFCNFLNNDKEEIEDFGKVEIKDYGNFNGVRMHSILEFQGSIDM